MPIDPIIAGNISSYLGKDSREVASSASSVFCQIARANTQNRRDASTSVAGVQVGFGRLGRSRRNTRRQRRDAAAPYSRHDMLQRSTAHRKGQGNCNSGHGTELATSEATQPLIAHTSTAHSADLTQCNRRKGEDGSDGDKSVSHEVWSEPQPSSTFCAGLPDAKQTVEQ